MSATVPIVIRPGVLTPCCDRIPSRHTLTEWVCAGCGTIYGDASRMIRDAFPGAVDVTSWIPEHAR